MNNSRRSSVLVTGGAGNIGSALVQRLSNLENTKVVVADNLLTGSESKLRGEGFGDYRFVKCDVNDFSDISSLFYRFGFTHVFHFAAVVGVQRTLDNPIWVLNDIDGIRNILNLSKNTGVHHVYFASSSEVYGEPFEIPQNEMSTPLNSRLPYAVVKNLGEVFLRTYHREFQLPYTIFRFFNTYGPNQSEDFVLPKFVRAAMQDEPIRVYGDGSQTRTFCYVDDTVDTCVQAFLNRAFKNDVLNVGSDVEMTIADLAHLVIEVTKSKSRIEYLPPLSEGDMTRRCPDVAKMREILARDLVDLAEGIARLAEHYRSFPDR